METHKKERAVLRRNFTVKSKVINEMFADVSCHQNLEINAAIQVLSITAERIFKLDELILQGMLNDETIDEDKLFAEQEQADTYRHQWAIILESNKVRENEEVRSLHNFSINQNSTKRNFNLPKLELIKFDGEVKNWIAFWGQFQKIHNDDSIDEHDKFQYLIQATVKGSKARSLIDSFPPSSDNYSKALNHLKTRFARDELIIEVYVRELISLIISQTKSSHQMNLDDLYDKLNTQLRALESLGVTTDKYAAMLFPIVESSLSIDVLKAWQRSQAGTLNKEAGMNLNNLFEFLKFEVESNQRILLARAGFSGEDNMSDLTDEKVQPSTASCLVDTNKTKYVCIWCDKPSHSSAECYLISKLSFEERTACIKKKKGCIVCLRAGHHGSVCKSYVKCILCSKRHNLIMCPQLQSERAKIEPKKVVTQNTELSLSHRSSITILQTLLVKIVHNNKHLIVRALFDNGAQRSYLTKNIIDELKLPMVTKESLAHCVFGGIETKRKVHQLYNITLLSLDNKFEFKMNVLDENKICGTLPTIKANDISQEQIQKHSITLTDIGTHPLEISLLIGADFSGYLYTNNNIVELNDGLFAVNTKLGWTIQGQKSGVYNSVMMLTCVNNVNISELWDLEFIGIRDPAQTKSKEMLECEIIKSFNETITINNEGRYEVQLPWKENRDTLLSNYDLAKKRLISTTKRLCSTNNFETYQNIFEDWMQRGVIEEVVDDNNKKGHYLPHHAVIKESSITTRVRPVFDASAKDRRGNTLNICLEKGPNLLEIIPKLLTKFRMHSIGVTSDIKKAFLQISIVEKDRDYVKFLWWRDYKNKELMTYKHRRVVFGLAPSPFLLNATIQYHLSKYTTEYYETATKLKDSFYVDNCIVSLEEDKVEHFIQCAKDILLSAQFDLRGWITTFNKNSKQTNEVCTTNILGMLWDTSSDELYCNIPDNLINSDFTSKRSLLSIAQKIFDPIGFIAPTLLLPKIILQNTWKLKCGWDDKLPTNITEQFKDWTKQITLLRNCRIPRRLTIYPITKCKRSLHVFCDASKIAYATCIFLRSEFNNNVHVQLLTAKTRITPTKQTITIPRLELLSALIATRLCEQVKSSLNLDCQIYYWSDSTVALTWIKKESPWATFIQNRVSEIRKYTNINDWYHVPGTLNPADLLSRGCNPKALVNSVWWEGPPWLKTNEESWPNDMYIEDNNAKLELKRSAVHTVNTQELFTDRLLYFSKYSKIVNMVAWMIRFVNNCRLKKNNNELQTINFINSEEFKNAKMRIFNILQKESFEISGDKRINGINVYKDDDGLLKVQTKVILSNEIDSFKYPIILPDNNEIIERLIRQKHEVLQHAGLQTMMNVLRESYWIICIRRLIKKVIYKCIICKRFKAKKYESHLAPLPYNRVNQYVGVFEVCGIDLAGPLYLRSGTKCYIVLFTCAVYRAVHMELTQSLSTDNFLMALRRFIARRGRISTIYSDNGTNFVGASNLFNTLDWSTIQRETNIKQIKWIFNPPTAAWWGGWWERLVRTIKELLRRVLGKAVVTYIEMETILCDCEAVINSRPLSYVNNESAELTPISPNSFLQSIPHNNVSDIDNIDTNSLNSRLQFIQKLRDDLRQRFKNEYLALLIQRCRERRTKVNSGDIVLVETDKKRTDWPIGVILELYPGVDGVSRVAKVRTSVGEKLRPIQRLYPLEINQKELPTPSVGQEITTRSGRVVKAPSKLNL